MLRPSACNAIAARRRMYVMGLGVACYAHTENRTFPIAPRGRRMGDVSKIAGDVSKNVPSGHIANYVADRWLM